MPTLNETLEAQPGVPETVVETPEQKPAVVNAVVVSKKKKKEVTEVTPVSEEKKFLRPPLEILTQDFERFLATLTIGDKPLQRLGYKCGKVIYGVPQTKADGSKAKDFRVIAFKARKKSEKVEGKSRCIFYFGLTDHIATSDLKTNYPGAQSSKFGKCSVQSKCPVEIILDKVTFTEIFEKDIEKVFDILKRLSATTITQKTAQLAKLTTETPKKKTETSKKKPETSKKKPVTA